MVRDHNRGCTGADVHGTFILDVTMRREISGSSFESSPGDALFSSFFHPAVEAIERPMRIWYLTTEIGVESKILVLYLDIEALSW
jgi:hypothetical protein